MVHKHFIKNAVIFTAMILIVGGDPPGKRHQPEPVLAGTG